MNSCFTGWWQSANLLAVSGPACDWQPELQRHSQGRWDSKNQQEAERNLDIQVPRLAQAHGIAQIGSPPCVRDSDTWKNTNYPSLSLPPSMSQHYPRALIRLPPAFRAAPGVERRRVCVCVLVFFYYCDRLDEKIKLKGRKGYFSPRSVDLIVLGPGVWLKQYWEETQAASMHTQRAQMAPSKT